MTVPSLPQARADTRPGAQLALAFDLDPIVAALISPNADITTLAPDSLWATVRVASVEQLHAAMHLLVDAECRGRAPVLVAAIARLRRMEQS